MRKEYKMKWKSSLCHCKCSFWTYISENGHNGEGMGEMQMEAREFYYTNSLICEEKFSVQIKLLNLRKDEYLIIIKEFYNNLHNGERK